MGVIEWVVFAGCAGFALVVVITILVVIGVSHEEKTKALTHRDPPTVPALLARRVLGTYVRRPREGPDSPGGNVADLGKLGTRVHSVTEPGI
jgi:hypothetical protein